MDETHPGRPPRSRVGVHVATESARGLVVVAGAFDRTAADRVVRAADQLVAVGLVELWLDLRAVGEFGSAALAALRRVAARAQRERVALRLVLPAGSVAGMVETSGLARAVPIHGALPPDLRRAGWRPATQGEPRHGAISKAVAAVLAEDPDLGEGLAEGALAAATAALVAPVVDVPRGAWDGALRHEPAIGLLVLDGWLVRRVGDGHGHGAELIGPRDLLRGPAERRGAGTPWFDASMRVIRPLRVAVLDEHFAQRLRGHPRIIANLLSRATARTHHLAAGLAVAHDPRVERRVQLVLWSLAQRWGRVCREGIRLELPLTHAVLADLTAARRPSVTLALQGLERDGALVREPGCFLLCGAPPAVGQDRDGAGRLTVARR